MNKLCHTATLAPVGWYLLIPPFVGPWHFDATAPPSKWKHMDSFDSAADCDTFRASMAIQFKAKGDNRAAQITAQLYDDARCIASDDRRLLPVLNRK